MGENFSTDDEDILEGDEPAPEAIVTPAPKPSRAWRSIERYREMRELRRSLDDLLLEDAASAGLEDITL